MAHVTIRASDVSSLCGRHFSKSSDMACQELLQTIHPLLKTGCDKLKVIITQVEQHVRSGPNYKSAVRERILTNDICQRAEKEALEHLREFVKRYKPSLDMTEHGRLKKYIRTIYLKDRGLIMEKDILSRLNDETEIKYTPIDKTLRFFSRTFIHPHFSYTINGSVDGLVFEDNVPKAILEVKSRKDRLQFHTHEIDQVMMYLVISGVKYGRLVQDVRGVIDTSFVMTLDEAEERWDKEVRPELEQVLGDVFRQVREISKQRANDWRPFRKILNRHL